MQNSNATLNNSLPIQPSEEAISIYALALAKRAMRRRAEKRQAAELELTGKTQEQERQAAKDAEEAKKAAAKEEARLAESKRKAREANEIKVRGENAADRFELGGSAIDELSGQQDLLSAPAPKPVDKPAAKEAPIEKPTADAKPDEAPQPTADKASRDGDPNIDDKEYAKLQAELAAALADLGDILITTSGARSIVPQDNAKLLPVLVRLLIQVFDLATASSKTWLSSRLIS